MKPLKLSTKKLLYKPITIEIDGKLYESKPINRAMLEQMSELESQIRSGNAQSAYDQVKLMFGNHSVFDKLDLRQINDIISYVTTCLFRPEKVKEEQPEKNRKRPGNSE